MRVSSGGPNKLDQAAGCGDAFSAKSSEEREMRLTSSSGNGRSDLRPRIPRTRGRVETLRCRSTYRMRFQDIREYVPSPPPHGQAFFLCHDADNFVRRTILRYSRRDARGCSHQHAIANRLQESDYLTFTRFSDEDDQGHR